jgi:hypothetical protein
LPPCRVARADSARRVVVEVITLSLNKSRSDRFVIVVPF